MNRIEIYNLDTGEQRMVVDRSGTGALIDVVVLSGDLLFYTEQYPHNAEESTAGPWKIMSRDLRTGKSRVVASDGGRPELQRVHASFDVDGTRVLWGTPSVKPRAAHDEITLHVADLSGANSREIFTGHVISSTLIGGRAVVLAPLSPTTVDAFVVDEAAGSLDPLTRKGIVSRVEKGTEDFVVVEENRDGWLHLKKVPFNNPEATTDFGGKASNVAIGDGFALWWRESGLESTVVATLDNLIQEKLIPATGSIWVATRTAAHGDLAVWGEVADHDPDTPIEVVVARVRVAASGTPRQRCCAATAGHRATHLLHR